MVVDAKDGYKLGSLVDAVDHEKRRAGHPGLVEITNRMTCANRVWMPGKRSVDEAVQPVECTLGNTLPEMGYTKCEPALDVLAGAATLIRKALHAERLPWYRQLMIKVLEQAIEKVKTLSEERQQYAARVLEQIAEAGEAVYPLTDEERRLVREGLDDLDAGRVVSGADMDGFWNRHRA